MGTTVVGQSRVGVSLIAFMACVALCACESEGDSGPRASESAGVGATSLSAAELARAAVTATDLDGYEINKTLTATSASRRTAEPAACDPVVQALGGSSAVTAVARVGRTISSEKDSATGATMILSSHSGEDAVRVIRALRTAAERCETFKDVAVGFRYDDVEVRPDPHYGDESVSLRLTQLAALSEDEEAIRVPSAVLAVRQGATVAVFHQFNRPEKNGETDPAVIPEAIVRAQLEKLTATR
ncbi:hypothetical protein [Streptomyces sp. NPDC001536]|uniref:hypothetical protein n=1 Tax=Streptomyces sp. NPDC001536 TaxID=3364583 RepID=UPI0036836696